MKLVQLLAKELKEWPEGAGDVVGQARDGRLHLNGSYEENRGFTDEQYTIAKDWMSSDVTKSQWKAEREKMNKPKWIRHRGGKCPVADGVDVTYRLRGGYVGTVQSECLMWDHQKDESDLMAYYIEEAKDQEIEEVRKFSKDVDMNIGQGEIIHGPVSIGDTVITAAHPKFDTNLGTLTYKLEIDATGANKELDSLVAKWGQIESPLKWRDEIIELEAYEEEFRREREKLIRKLESEGFKLIYHVQPVYGEQIIDMSDWRNWQVGDVFVTDGQCHYYTKGKEYVVQSLANDDAPIKAIDDDGDEFCLYMNEVKFIRRP